MPCFLCSSETHLSLHCTTFTSNESRKDIAQLKDHCDSCLTSLKSCGTHKNGKCSNFRKCYICFSRKHHTVFCPDRFGVPSLIFPKVDGLFFQRFFKMFNPAEQFLLIYSLTEPEKLCALKHVKVLYRDLWFNKFTDEEYTPTIIVTQKFLFQNVEPNQKLYSQLRNATLEYTPNFFNALSSQVIIFKAITVALVSSQITCQGLFKLLSPLTKVLIFKKLKLSTNVNFSTILKKTPNIETIEISDSNININNKWPEELLQYCHGSNFNKLKITCNNLNINYNELVTFMKAKSSKNVHIILYVDYTFEKKEICQKLSKNFLAGKSYDCENRFLSICNSKNLHHFETFMLKNL